MKKLKRTITQLSSSKEGRDEKGDDTAFHNETGTQALIKKYRAAFPKYASYADQLLGKNTNSKETD